MTEQYPVSVKGILYHEQKLLLRINQRQEYELLGGKLCCTDESIIQRLKTEFLEESGIQVEVLTQREPWLYVIGTKPVLILPCLCCCRTVPSVLYDEDGGKLSWVAEEELGYLHIPHGYADSIRNEVPRASYSSAEGTFPVYIPDYIEDQYAIRVELAAPDGHVFFSATLSGTQNPRDFLVSRYPIGNDLFYSQATIETKTLVLKYVLMQ